MWNLILQTTPIGNIWAPNLWHCHQRCFQFKFINELSMKMYKLNSLYTGECFTKCKYFMTIPSWCIIMHTTIKLSILFLFCTTFRDKVHTNIKHYINVYFLLLYWMEFNQFHHAFIRGFKNIYLSNSSSFCVVWVILF